MPIRPDLAALLCLAAGITLPVTAVAEAPVWVPVIVEHEGSDRTRELVREVALGLDARGIELLDPQLAARRFESAHSLGAVAVQDQELQTLGNSVQSAMRLAAMGKWDEAYRSVAAFDALSLPAQDYVKWRLKLSQDLFDYCLMNVRFLLDSERAAVAREEMVRCIHATPDRRPDPAYTSVEVLRIYEDVRAYLGRASLAVDVAVDATADQPAAADCAVIVNGQPKGTLPFTEESLFPSTARVQVNCQRPGRIHFVRLEPGRTSLVVDWRFEQAIHSGDHLGLRYATPKQEEVSQVRDGVAVARVLGATDVLLVRRTESGRVAFIRIDARLAKAVSDVTLADSPSVSEIRVAARALVTGGSGDVMPEPEAATVVSSPGQPRSEHAAERRALAAGTVTAAAGAATLGLAWHQYAQRLGARDRFESRGSLASLARYEDAGVFSAVLGGIGGVLGAASVPTLLPEADGVPWWSWAIGTAGLGTAVAGAVVWQSGERCDPGGCERGALDPVLGQLIMLHAAPLLSVPITHGVRALVGTDGLSAGLRVGPGSARIELGGRL